MQPAPTRKSKGSSETTQVSFESGERDRQNPEWGYALDLQNFNEFNDPEDVVCY